MITNYARLLELNQYKTVNESVIAEAQANPLDLIKNGRDGMYANQWNQILNAIKSQIDKNPATTSGTVQVYHDKNVQNGALIATVDWNESNLEITLSLSQTAGSTPVSNAPQSIKDAAQQIWVALEGSSFTEDEDSVYKVFTDLIKTDADLKSLLAYWKSLKIPFIKGGIPGYDSSLEKTAANYKNEKPNQWNHPLDFWLAGLFNSDEIGKLNQIISKYSTYKFKA
jgi:hypothetical protein